MRTANIPDEVRRTGQPPANKLRQQRHASVGERPLKQHDRQRRVVADRGDDDVKAGGLKPPTAHLTAHAVKRQLHDGRHGLTIGHHH